MYIIQVDCSECSAYLTKLEQALGYKWVVYRLSNNPKEELRSIVKEHDENHTLIANIHFEIILDNNELCKLTCISKTQHGKIEIKNS